MSNALPELSIEFRHFLIESKRHGYATGGAEKVTESGAKEIVYERGDWRYTNNYVGGDTFMGYEHVSVRHPEDPTKWLPIWSMNYEGGIFDGRMSEVELASWLGKVLCRPDDNLPIRGPFNFRNSEGVYSLMPYKGADRLELFQAEESIRTHDGRMLYAASFVGQLVNRKLELENQAQIWLKPPMAKERRYAAKAKN